MEDDHENKISTQVSSITTDNSVNKCNLPGYTTVTLKVVNVNVHQVQAVMFPFGFGWVTVLSTPFQVISRLFQCVCVHMFQSVADVALQCFLDELETALIQK